MTDGAGKGPGLTGEGSQNAADGASTGDATPGSGAVVETAQPSHSKNAASPGMVGGVDKAPFVLAALVLGLSLVGTVLL